MGEQAFADEIARLADKATAYGEGAEVTPVLSYRDGGLIPLREVIEDVPLHPRLKRCLTLVAEGFPLELVRRLHERDGEDELATLKRRLQDEAIAIEALADNTAPATIRRIMGPPHR